MDLDEYYFGVHLDKVTDLDASSRGKQVNCDIELQERYKGETLKDEAESMNAIGPDCSFAQSFFFFTKGLNVSSSWATTLKTPKVKSKESRRIFKVLFSSSM